MPDNRFQVSKWDDEQCLVFGWANVSVSKSTSAGVGGEQFFDLQQDSIPPGDLERAAYDFVLDFRETDEQHTDDVKGMLVESMVFTPEKLEKLVTDPVTGTVDREGLAILQKHLPPRWWVGFKLEKSTYTRVKEGVYKMFSVAGEADRVEV